MVLYHATTRVNGEKILKDRVIECHAQKIFNTDISDCIRNNESLVIDTCTRTTDGYVYLTDSLIFAVYHGSMATIYSQKELVERKFYVFRIEINDRELLPDRDNLSILIDKKYREAAATAEQSLRLCSSVCLQRNILIDVEPTAYAVCSTSIFDESQVIPEMARMHDLVTKEDLNEYQKEAMKKAVLSFESAYKWIDII